MIGPSMSCLWSRGRPVCLFLAVTLLAVMVASGQQDIRQIDRVVRAETIHVPEDLTIRARLKAILPSEPSVIRWRYGGEGQGGEVIRGIFAKAEVPGNASDESHALAAYYTRDFNNYATARLFTRLRDVFAEANAKERANSSASLTPG